MNEVDELLASFSADIPHADAAERKATEMARGTLRAAILAESSRKHRFRRPARFGRLAIASCLAVAIIAIAAVIPSIGGDGGRLGTASASAAVVLEHAARALELQPWRPLQPGEYDYIRSAANYPSSGPAGRKPFEIDEAWIAGDGSGRLLQRASSGTDVIPFGSPKRVHIGGPGSGEREPWAWAGLDYQQLIDLPTDPAVLQRWVQQRTASYGQQPPTEEAFTMVGDLLRDAPAPPKLRAAMFRVVARLPGVKLVGPARDELGRQGVAVGLSIGTSRDDLIFNPDTGALLAERRVSLSSKSGAPAGTILSWNVIEVEAIVHSDHQRPGAHRGASRPSR
jgi:hypothetical protein